MFGRIDIPTTIALALAGGACVFALNQMAFLTNVSALSAFLVWMLLVD